MARKRTTASVAISRRLQEAFGKRLQNARRTTAKHVPQQDLATALTVSRTTISNIEHGRHRVFLDQAYSAARMLGVSIESLLPPMAEVFPDAALFTSVDVDFDQATTQAVTEVARGLSAELAAASRKTVKSRGRR